MLRQAPGKVKGPGGPPVAGKEIAGEGPGMAEADRMEDGSGVCKIGETGMSSRVVGRLHVGLGPLHMRDGVVKEERKTAGTMRRARPSGTIGERRALRGRYRVIG